MAGAVLGVVEGDAAAVLEEGRHDAGCVGGEVCDGKADAVAAECSEGVDRGILSGRRDLPMSTRPMRSCVGVTAMAF